MSRSEQQQRARPPANPIALPPRPVIYEINTWVWLQELGQRYGKPMTLGDVPATEWDALAALQIDAVWFMGVWERSPAGIAVAMQNEGLKQDFRRALPDLTPADVVGSAYCVRRYRVDDRLGGPQGLAAARARLAERSIGLILDFVPNHVAPDHPWIGEHPEYFIRGTAEDLSQAPSEFFQSGDIVIANGRDPYFAPWLDVAQLNGFHPGMRKAVIETLNDIAAQCDGMRCDMAMLMTGDVFERTWGARAGVRPAEEYWREVLPAVRANHPHIRFIAEVYWDMEWEMQQQGFDFTYDKRLYDRLEHEGPESIRGHLSADPAYQEKLVRFIENHDEPRAAAVFGPERERAVAVVSSTLPGALLFHEGQFEGRQVRLPVYLGRRPPEPVDADLQSFYRRLLQAIRTPALRKGEWRLCELQDRPNNPGYRQVVAWCWRYGDDRRLIVANLSAEAAQARVHIPWSDLAGKAWRLDDALGDHAFDRSGDEMQSAGLNVELPGWGYHFLAFYPS